MNMGGMPSIFINIITPKCSHLVRMVLHNNGNNAELSANGHGVIKYRCYLIGARRSYNIVITGNITKNKVTDTTADKIRFIT